jgi:hypothetical protein
LAILNLHERLFLCHPQGVDEAGGNSGGRADARARRGHSSGGLSDRRGGVCGRPNCRPWWHRFRVHPPVFPAIARSTRGAWPFARAHILTAPAMQVYTHQFFSEVGGVMQDHTADLRASAQEARATPEDDGDDGM